MLLLNPSQHAFTARDRTELVPGRSLGPSPLRCTTVGLPWESFLAAVDRGMAAVKQTCLSYSNYVRLDDNIL